MNKITEDIAAIAIDAIRDRFGKDTEVCRDDRCATEECFGMDAAERFEVGGRHKYCSGLAHQLAALFDPDYPDVFAVARKLALAGDDEALAELLADFLGDAPALAVDEAADEEEVIIRLVGKRKFFFIVVVRDDRIVEIAIVIAVVAMDVVHVRVGFEYAVVAEDAVVADAVLDGQVIGKRLGDNLLAGTADETDEVARLDTFGHCPDCVGVHLDPTWIVDAPGDVEKLFGVIAITENFMLLVFGDHRDEFADAGFVVLAGVQDDVVPKIGHHIAKLTHFLRVGAVGVFGGSLRVREIDNVEGKFLHSLW